jgi:hypothetical protein
MTQTTGKLSLNSFFDETLDKALIIQNTLGGPLVLSDLEDLVLYSGETYIWDLNPEDERKLRRSNSLRRAIRDNLVRQLDADQYQRELELEEARAMSESYENDVELTRVDVGDNIAIDVEKIDLTNDAIRSVEGRKKRTAAIQELKTDPVAYAKLQAQMRVQNPNLSPHDFAKMVNQNPAIVQQMMNNNDNQHSGRGRSTVAMPNGRGNTDAYSSDMGNFARDGHLQGVRSFKSQNRGYNDVDNEFYQDDFAETIDLSDDRGIGGRISTL